MRVLRLGRIAAQAEGLRLKRLVRRHVMRGVLGAVAAVFAIFMLAWLHVAGDLALIPQVGPLYAALIVAGIDLVLLAVFAAVAAFNGPDRIEVEALAVREQARAQMAQAAVMTAVVGPVLRRAGVGLVERVLGRRQR